MSAPPISPAKLIGATPHFDHPPCKTAENLIQSLHGQYVPKEECTVEMVPILLLLTMKIVGSFLVMMLLAALSLKVAAAWRMPFISPLIMGTITIALVIINEVLSRLPLMLLAFGVTSTILLLLGVFFSSSDAARNGVGGRRLKHWNYPALIASIGERRRPTRFELRCLLTRLRSEVRSTGRSSGSNVRLIKSIARLAIKNDSNFD